MVALLGMTIGCGGTPQRTVPLSAPTPSDSTVVAADSAERLEQTWSYFRELPTSRRALTALLGQPDSVVAETRAQSHIAHVDTVIAVHYPSLTFDIFRSGDSTDKEFITGLEARGPVLDVPHINVGRACVAARSSFGRPSEERSEDGERALTFTISDDGASSYIVVVCRSDRISRIVWLPYSG